MPYFAHNRRTGRQASQRGASLIEVLVALVLLVVGIYSIARLFPGGFSAIRSSQNAAFADRLAQSQLEALKQNDQFLLNAVYMVAPDGTFLSNFSPTDYGNDYPSVQNPNAAYNDINKARYISGEQFIVPAANTNTTNPATNGVSLHVLNYGPVVLGPAAMPLSQITSSSAPANVRGLPPVHSGPWTAKVGISTPGINDPAAYNLNPGGGDLPSDLLGSGGPIYAIDYTGQEIAVPPAPYEQYFTLALKQLMTIPAAGSTSAFTEIVTYYFPLAIPPESTDGTTVDTSSNYNGGWFNPTPASNLVYLDPTRAIITDQPLPPNGVLSGWVPNSASLTCTLTSVQSIPALLSSVNPYTYTFYQSDPNLVSTNAANSVNLGIMALNPRLAGQTVSVSYLTYNWHILHDDEDVPNSADTPLHLAVDHVKRAGAVQADQSIYSGLFGSDVGAAGQYDIVLLDTDTGQSVGLNVANDVGTGGSEYDLDNQTGPTAGGNTPDPNTFRVSYQNGTILLPDSVYTAAPNTAAGMFVTEPHTHLRIFYEGDYDWAVALQKGPNIYTQVSPPPPPQPLGAGEFALVQNGGTAHLHFPASDMEQSVEIDDVHYTDTNGASQMVGSVTGTIGTDYLDTQYVDLGQYLPNVNLSQPITIGAVRGVSARAVVLWKERGQWKALTQSTILGSGQ